MGIAWRYLIPRTQYFKSLKIARACPEISSHIDRAALYTLGSASITALMFAAVSVIFPVVWLADKLGRTAFEHLPDFESRRNEAIREAHRIVPVEEICRRIGLPTERGIILAKAEASQASGGSQIRDAA